MSLPLEPNDESEQEIIVNQQQKNILLQKTQKFSEIQKYHYRLELSKEEDETLSLLENPDETYLTKKGILLNNLKLIEKEFTSYGKVEIGFQSI